MSKEYTGELYDYFHGRLNGKLVFDIGAHVGKLTRKFINMGAIVVAVEPQIELESNFHGVLAVENVCISNKLGQTIFYKCNRSTISTCCSDWKDGHPNLKYTEIRVPTLTLDNLVEKYGVPLYVKVDVEGYEDKVLGGLSCRVEFISIEYTRVFEEQFIRCIEEINRLGFSKLVAYKKIKYTNVRDGEFTNTDDLLYYFRNLSERSQGDLLII